MKAIIKVKTIEEDWEPPFEKKIKEQQLEVNPGQNFEKIPDREEFVFKLLEIKNEKALIQFHNLFNLKSFESPSRDRQIWIKKGEELRFVAQWTSYGVTKILSLQEIY